MDDRISPMHHIYVIVLHSKKGREPLITLVKIKNLFIYAQTLKFCCISRFSKKKRTKRNGFYKLAMLMVKVDFS
ncbi:hypothetical protein CEQ21_24480 [Niallia circulans]|uniref:Uncharacterized protein n=1 Tax=Niallia circulans TaxID=1397 RepID=A0A553SNH2_NIACI|nr:hypothetical protein CEQ21_24480 [Niallia circulans]